MSDFILVLPETFILLTLLFLLFSQLGTGSIGKNWSTGIVITGLAGSALQVFLAKEQFGIRSDVVGFGSTIQVDGLSYLFRLFAILTGIMAVFTVSRSREVGVDRKNAVYVLILTLVFGLSLAALANDGAFLLIVLFSAVLATNLILFFSRETRELVESGTQFWISSWAGISFFALGLFILYSHTSTFHFNDLKALLQAGGALDSDGSLGLGVGTALTFLLMGTVSLLCVFPFHFFAPEAFGGAGAFLSTPLMLFQRGMGVLVAVRIFYEVFSIGHPKQSEWVANHHLSEVLLILSGASLVLGPILAMGQTRLKKILGCLIISFSAAPLIGIASASSSGLVAGLFDLWTALWSVGGIYYLLSSYTEALGSDELEQIKRTFGKSVFEGGLLTLFLLSISGIPPLPGFFSKFLLADTLLANHNYFLFGVFILSWMLTACISARLVVVLLLEFRSAGARSLQTAQGEKLTSVLLLAPLLITILFSERIFTSIRNSIAFIFQ